MNVTQAQYILENIRLELGNLQHILAVNTLSRWEDYENLIKEHCYDIIHEALNCDVCDGSGEIEEYECNCTDYGYSCTCDIPTLTCDDCGGVGNFYPTKSSTVKDIDDAIYLIEREVKRRNR